MGGGRVVCNGIPFTIEKIPASKGLNPRPLDQQVSA